MSTRADEGLTLCHKLRARPEPPVIMLTARSDETGRINCLPKPFSAREQLARVKVILKRVRSLPPNMQPDENAELVDLTQGREADPLGLACIYNRLRLPLAASVLFPFTAGLPSPMIAALAMSLSSASVIFNALRMRSATLG